MPKSELPCPFCGSFAVTSISFEIGLFAAHCTDCNASGPVEASFETALLEWQGIVVTVDRRPVLHPRDETLDATAST